ncbi:formyltetrahydrofolate deformylase [Bordetella genomosp. 8]|uniref:Formyltetrahydrofolate deformylase n=1 Tax=Bordetella genomosp. 8 TaxID=1416806 RepID=A0A1W6YHD2_9BORD|nr:formyltetrahydrofolate deformylase [Bordetella genomosp. 8]ARP80450.1 formyltetrahydrofolate deformylase [Bordetella genomosp. 8]
MKKFVLKVTCQDQRGIVGAVGQGVASLGGCITESGQFVDPTTGRLFMRVCFQFDSDVPHQAIDRHFEPVVQRYRMRMETFDLTQRPKVLIMVSQLGHCLNDLLYRNSIDQLPLQLVGVVSNHTVYRSRVEHEGIPFHHLPVTPDNKAEQERALLGLLESLEVDLVVLARYMQILSDDLCRRLPGKVINIHHSFLPSFKGAKPYHQAYERGVKLIGATAHYVTADLDEGPIIEQDIRRVDHATSPEEMVAIGRDTECQVLAKAVKTHVEHRILLNENRTIIF